MKSIPLLVLGALFLPGTGCGQEPGGLWARQVHGYLERATAALASAGFRAADHSPAGALNEDESAFFPVTLRGGASYVVVAVCDADCVGLDLLLQDSYHQDLAAERGRNVPSVKFTPRETAPYRVKLVMRSCQLNPCWYGIGVYAKPTPRAP